MLEKVYYGNTLEDWGISILIIIGVFVLNKSIVLLNKYILKKLAHKNKNRIDDILVQAVEKPILLGFILIAIWVASRRLNLGAETHATIATAYHVLIVLNATWLIARFTVGLIEEYAATPKGDDSPRKNKRQFNQRLLPLLKRTILIVIWIIGIVMALNNVGIKVTTLLGTLGIGGIAFALAAQDTIKNIFGGITIFADGTFKIGDTIRVDSVEGTVEDIGLRSTRIRTYEKRTVTVPNFKLMDAFVTNIAEEPARRVLIKLGLTYDTSPQKMTEALEILKEIALFVPEVNNNDTTTIFSEFGDSALIITFIYFIKKKSDYLQVSSNVNFEILHRFNEAGLSFAFPSQTLYIENENSNPAKDRKGD